MSQLSLLPECAITTAILSTKGRFSGHTIKAKVKEKMHVICDEILTLHEQGFLIEHKSYTNDLVPSKRYLGYTSEWECKVQ